ncbi:hypothetical protein DPMN_106994 [Dreissena polymorpha]|uniref:Protein MAK10 homolog n=2 Tax=Dreissena polymorpha TaxID=45954 RepID=A0A9D4K683_DREPO|nr:hypothetical protein DPMN_106994 [Dreissena polymorpha]
MSQESSSNVQDGVQQSKDCSRDDKTALYIPKYNWECITDVFVEACKDLELGELLHDSTFGLFEAMSAIEMMDEKMDAGMMCNQTKRPVLDLHTSVDTGLVKVTGLTYPELIGIMDSSLSCMVTWLEGHSLAQTVFTNLYLHDPHKVEDKPLRTFCLCMLKIVDLLRDRINKAGVYEEEDFQPLTYGFKMGGDVTDVKVISTMKEVEEDLNRALRHLKGQVQEGNAESTIEYQQCGAVCTRVKFFKGLLSMLVALSKDKCEGVPQAKKLISQILEFIEPIRSTISLGIVPEDREITKNDYPTIMGFDPLINQRLLPPTFPRYTVIHTREDAISYVKKLLHRIDTATAVLNASNIQEVFEVFREFSDTSPCVVSRSILQLMFLPPSRKVFGVHTLTDFLKDSVRAFVMPPVLSPKAHTSISVEVKQYVDSLMTRAVRPICTVLQVLGHNRARQRDKWAHLLDDLVTLQDEADKVDGYLHQVQMKADPSHQLGSSFGTWVLYYTIHVMLAYTLSGFELELYAPYEYHYVYWYLYELLYSWMYSTIQRAESFVIEHEAYIANTQGGSADDFQIGSEGDHSVEGARVRKKLKLKKREWISAETLQSIEERREEYTSTNMNFKQSVRADNRNNLVATEEDDAAHRSKNNDLHFINKRIAGKYSKPEMPLRDMNVRVGVM